MFHKPLLIILATSVAVTACSERLTNPVDDELLSAALSHTSRPPVLGESQPLVDLTRGFTYAIFPEDQGQVLVQTFTPTRKQRLRFIEIPVGCAAGVVLLLRVREGVNGPILSEFPAGGLPEVVDGTFQTFSVFDPLISHGIKLKKNTTYAFELSAFPSGVSNTCGIAPGPVGDSYSGGQAFSEDVPINGPGFIPFPGGEDLPFRTLVR